MNLEEMFGQAEPAPPPAEIAEIPGQMTVDEVIQEAETEEQFVTETTPSGLEIYYSWAPRRHYKIRRLCSDDELSAMDSLSPEWVEVPSVTTVLGVLDKSGPLTWWGMKVGIEGCQRLHTEGYTLPLLSVDEIVALLTEYKLTVNHQMDKAADRGVNVHGALEKWYARDSIDPADYPEHERGYVTGLLAFLGAVDEAQVQSELRSEVMVGSLEHQYAGRYDLRLTLEKPVEVVTKAFPKRADKVEEIPAGRYLLDLKTRKKAAVYNSNWLQLEAYERASVECGYEPTDYRGVIVVTEGGQYQLSINQDWTFDDFAQVRGTYRVLHEREILRELREELGAKDAA